MIKQRILYVGIGGSGIDLGIELDSALKREICGLDGNALAQKGMPYKTNELPPFVQQVYIDFAAAAVAGVARQLVGSNARTITNIIPPIQNYAGVANALRLHNINEVQSWLPGQANEPHVNPLSAGAGQYPTVGRAAMYQSIQGQGLDQAILNPIRDAIADLSGSMGDLREYTGATHSNNVAVYVGFSASGGTGAGLFYDVLMMLIDELTTHMAEPVVVMPAVLLPSTFDGVLPPTQAKRAQLNASTALVDLANMIEQMSRMDPSANRDFSVVYPNSGNKTYSLLSNTRTVQMPVAAVVSSTPGMTRDDTVRMLASAIVTQVSLSGGAGGDGQVQNTMTFGENVVNWSGIISMDPKSVMHKPLMPMVSASLTVPSRKIADIVAKRLLHQAFTADGGSDQATGESLRDLGNRILKACNLGALIEGETFRGSYNVGFAAPAGIKSEKDLREKISRLQSQIDQQALPVIQTQIASTLRTMTTFDILEGMEQVIGSDPSISLPMLAAAAQNALAQLSLSDTPDDAASSNTSTSRKRAPKKGKLSFLPGKKLTQQAIKQEFELVERDFKNRVQEMWWQEWSRCRHQWRSSVNTGQNRVADLSSWWASLLASALDSAQSGSAAVATPRLGVRDFVPTRGVSVNQALDNIYNDTRTSLLATRPLAIPTTSNLVQSVLGEGRDGSRSSLRGALNLFRNNRSQHDFNEVILERLRSEVHSVFSRSVDGQQPAFSSLSSLLEEMIHSSPGSDAQALRTELGNLVPGVMVPNGEFVQASVNITYPGNTSREIEEQIAELVFSSAAMRELISAGPADPGVQLLGRAGVSIAAAGDSDSLTVNINLIGQTLFDNEEVCGVLQTWQRELSNPEQEKLNWRQRLGYSNMDRVLAGHSRTRTLHKLLVGLWGGQIEITEGSIENPKVLTVYDNNRQLGDNSLPELALGNGWTDLLKSFENFQMGLDRQGSFAADVIGQMLQNVPDVLKSSQTVDVPPVIAALLEFRKKALAEARNALSRPGEYGEQAVRDYQRRITFWEKEFDAAWKLRGMGLHAASLEVLLPLDA